MSNLWEKVDTILEKIEIPERHTFFQLKNFIVGKECTVQGQLWQIIRELKARKESIESLELQIEDAEDELELIDIRIERIQNDNKSTTDCFILRENAIIRKKTDRDRRRLIASIEKIKVKIKYLMEEINFFVGAYETLAKVQTVKPVDDIPSQKEYWNEKLYEELNLRLLLKNTLDANLVQTILSLDDDAPVKNHVIGMLKEVQQKAIEHRDQLRITAAEKRNK